MYNINLVYSIWVHRYLNPLSTVRIGQSAHLNPPELESLSYGHKPAYARVDWTEPTTLCRDNFFYNCSQGKAH